MEVRRIILSDKNVLCEGQQEDSEEESKHDAKKPEEPTKLAVIHSENTSNENESSNLRSRSNTMEF